MTHFFNSFVQFIQKSARKSSILRNIDKFMALQRDTPFGI